jgi:hypothetical protein
MTPSFGGIPMPVLLALFFLALSLGALVGPFGPRRG